MEHGGSFCNGAVETLAAELDDPDLQASVWYELGRFQRSHGKFAEAALCLERAFLKATDPTLSAHAGCALYQLSKDSRAGAVIHPPTRTQLETLAPTWDREVWIAAADAPTSNGLAARPSEAIVAFYRRQIGPAIGARCSLSPSCSQYFLEAGRRHGLMAFPIMADRLVREPSVVREQQHPVWDGKRMRFRDEVEWHTWWWAEAGRGP